MNRWLLFIVFNLSFTVNAEYRVFKLQFTNSKTKQTRQIQSTLDPVQYAELNPAKGETLTYVQTWRCKGRTDFFTPHCQGPEIKPVTK